MILADVNVLVHAFRPDASDHVTCRRWLDHVINGGARFGMSPQVLSEVVRITTHPRVFVRPNRLKDVMEFCNVLLGRPQCLVVQPGETSLGYLHAALHPRGRALQSCAGCMVCGAGN